MGFLAYCAVLPILIALSLVYLPGVWVPFFCLIDFHTPWVLFDSPWYNTYHNFLISTLPDREEIPLPTITVEEIDVENIRRLTKGFTEPLVIKGLLANSSSVQNWWNKEWWTEKYHDEEVLCGTLQQVVKDCTVGSFFKRRDEGTPFYISGASMIFKRNPELHEMVDNEELRTLTAAGGLERINTQVFMGFPKMGSDIHCASGINVFRMIVGQKKWWFIPPHQTAYLKPSINANAFSAHSQTMVGKGDETPSPWLKKLVRYTAVLSPGDVLVNPPWYWHGILNLGDAESQELVIGTPTRYKGGVSQKAMFDSNFLFSANFLGVMFSRYGLNLLKPGFSFNMEDAIRDNRRSREGEQVDTIHTGSSDMVQEVASTTAAVADPLA